MKLKDIEYIVVHCSATREGQPYDVEDIRDMHVRGRGWSDVGYHFIIKLDGTVQKGRDLDVMGAHVKGYNSKSIGICYIGGLDSEGKPKDTRTPAQKEAMLKLLQVLKVALPNAEILGHRDLSPDLDGDGEVEQREWTKSCPSFDVRLWLRNPDWFPPFVVN